MPTNASRKKVNVAKPAVEINVPINASRSSTPNTSASRRPTTPSSAPTSSRNISPFYNSHQRTAQSASTTFTHAAPSSARRLHVNEQQQVNQHSAKKNTPNHLVQNRSDSPSILSLLPKSPNPLVSANRNKQARKSIGSEADGEVEEVEQTKPDSSSHIQQNGIQNNNKNHHQNRLYYMSESPNYLDEGEIDFTLDKSVEGEGDDNRSVSSLGGLSAYSRISHASSHSKNNPAQETAKKGPNSLSSRSKLMNGKEKETNKPKSKSNYQQKSLVDHYKTRKSAPSSSNNSISSNGPEAYKHLDSVDLENHMMLEQLVAKKITSDSTKSPPAQTSDVSEASHEHKEPTEETNQHTSETDPKNAHSPPTIDPQSPPITNSKGKTPSSPSSHYVNPLYQHHSTPPPPPHEAKTISLAKEQPPSTVVDDNIYNYSYLYEDVPKKTSTSASKTKKPTSMEKAQLRLLKGEFEDNYGKTRGAWQTSLRR